MTTRAAILYASPNQTIFILDIPASHEEAQILLSAPNTHLRTFAASPLTSPWPSTEPKTAKARAQVLQRHNGLDAGELADAVEQALRAVREEKNVIWCLPRIVRDDEVEHPAAKRRRVDHPLVEKTARHYAEPLHVVRRLRAGHDHGMIVTLDVNGDREELAAANPTLLLTDDGARFGQHWDCSLVNTTTTTTTAANPLRLTATTPDRTSTATFTIPPRTTFLQSDLFRPGALHLIAASHLALYPSQTPKKFDLILLDPPWPNRSVRRATHNHLYASDPPHTLDELTTKLCTLPLDDLLSDDGVLGIWITNRAAVRAAVLESDASLFAAWDLELVEEWIWVKTTAYGEPVSSLRGVWRQPWEVLLLGRRKEGRGCTAGVRRRFVFAVPDAHSRKPSLRSVFERSWPSLSFDRSGSLAYENEEKEKKKQIVGLELFARSLTAGWCCVGDEVLRFQEVSWWSTGADGLHEEMGKEELDKA